MQYHIKNQNNPVSPLVLVLNSFLTYILLDLAFKNYHWDTTVKIIIFTVYTILNIARIITFFYLVANTKKIEITEDLKFKIKQ